MGAPSVAAVSSPTPTAAATPTPAPPLPAYALAALRARPLTHGAVAVGQVLSAGGGYTKYRCTWPSQGGTMTGVLDIPDGHGPFSVVIVNHGYVPVDQYYVGQDSNKYADALSAHGILSVSPDYPGYAGSSPPERDLPIIEAEALSDVDLIGALGSLPAADPARVAVAGHSNGGGVTEILMVVDPRVRAAVLYAPVSTDMADNARRFWLRSGHDSAGPLGDPDANPQGYALASPRPLLRGDGPPVLIIQGTNDEDIPADWTQATVDALHRVGEPVRFVSVAGAMHNLVGANLVNANALAEAWIRAGVEGTPLPS